jgi:hypothetical protein
VPDEERARDSWYRRAALDGSIAWSYWRNPTDHASFLDSPGCSWTKCSEKAVNQRSKLNITQNEKSDRRIMTLV